MSTITSLILFVCIAGDYCKERDILLFGVTEQQCMNGAQIILNDPKVGAVRPGETLKSWRCLEV